MHYYPREMKSLKKQKRFYFNKDNLTFDYSFPEIDLVQDQSYELYFEVSDNKPFHHQTGLSETFVYLNRSANSILKDKLIDQEQAVSTSKELFLSLISNKQI